MNFGVALLCRELWAEEREKGDRHDALIVKFLRRLQVVMRRD